MTTINFKNIRSTPTSQRDSFEELSIQLFRKCTKVPKNSSFISLRGDGGDGGVEAYFRTPTGSVIGVQAKYFFKLEASELAQIADSLSTALSNHPTLVEYHVYIPFNLTGRSGAGKRGKSQAERFEEWKNKVESAAAASGQPLQVILFAAASIQSQLQEIDSYGGVRRYWFDESTITAHQIEQLLQQAIEFAGPRYTADLDIETHAHTVLDIFGGIGDYHKWVDESLAPTISSLRSTHGYGTESFAILPALVKTKATALLDELLTILNELENRSSDDLSSRALDLLEQLAPILSEVRSLQEAAFHQEHGPNADTPSFRQFHAEFNVCFPAQGMDSARTYENTCNELRHVLTSGEFRASTVSSLLLTGSASIGKTHAIISAATRRLKRGGMSLVVFGENFDGKEPWEVLRSKLGYGSNMGQEELFETLQSCADHTGLPFVIFIDALNESTERRRWKGNLPALIRSLKPYPGIKICVSARDTYLSQVMDTTFKGLEFKHVGFAGKEFAALQAFSTYYGLDAEITPLFSPELRNPLFLQLTCKTLVAEGRRTLDLSLPGLTSLIESHLTHCDASVRERLHYVNPKNVVRSSAMALSRFLAEKPAPERTWENCVETLRPIIGAEASAELLLKELEHENLVIVTVHPNESTFVRMGFERYGDTLRALRLLEENATDGQLNFTDLASYLAKIDESEAGLLEAIAAALPERYSVEITSTKLGLPKERSYRAYVSSLTSRSRASFDDYTYERIRESLQTAGLWLDVFEAFFGLCLVPGHVLNAERWWADFFTHKSMVNRDVNLTYAAHGSFNKNGAARSLINSALKANISIWPGDSRRLAVLALGWLTSCSDRRIRDMSAKGITRLLEFEPALATELATSFARVDDDYIKEYVCLAIYSAYLLKRREDEAFIRALEVLVRSGWVDSANVLIRETVQQLAEALSRHNKLDATLTASLAGTKQRLPEVWPTMEDVAPLLEGMPSNMKLWDSGLSPDFWRYQVESKVFNFDLEGAGITHGNIACWVMSQAFLFGYPGSERRGLQLDRYFNQEYGSGRARSGFAERLGKKYYWIALHRLLGILADNVPIVSRYSNEELSQERFWSTDLRKVDLTDVRDIASARSYPDEIVQGPRYPFPERTSNTIAWVKSRDFSAHQDCLIRIANDKSEWVPLWFSARDNDRKPQEPYASDNYLSVYVSYKGMFVTDSALRERTVRRELESLGQQDCHTYKGYFAEYPDGDVYSQLADEGYLNIGTSGTSLAMVTLLRGNEWEYDYSWEDPAEGLDVPAPDIIRTLKLQWDHQRGWLNSAGELVAFSTSAEKRSGLYIRRADLHQYMDMTESILVYRMFAQKGHIDQRGQSPQVNINALLGYSPRKVSVEISEEVSPYNCESADAP